MKRDHTTPSGHFKPTPQEIGKECERIQAGWSPREREKREGKVNPKDSFYTIPIIRLRDTVENGG